MTKPKVNPLGLLRWVLYLVLTFLVLAGLAAVAVPPYLIRTIESQTLQQTGRKLTIDRVSFNLITLSVDVGGIKLYEANQSDLAVSADELLLKISPLALLKLAPVISEVKLTHPTLQLMRALQDGKEITNFSDVIARFAQSPSKGDPARFAVSNIQISNGAVQLDDRIAKKQVHVDALRLDVPFVSNFSTATNIYVEPFLSATVDGSKVELKGRSKPFSENLDTSLAIDISAFNLTELIAFSPVRLPVHVKSADLSTHLTLAFSNSNNEQHISLAGTASLNNLAIEDKSGAPLYAAKQINLNVQDANLVNQQFVLNSLDIIDPQIWVSMDPRGALNWASLTPQKTDESVDSSNTPKKQNQPKLTLAHFQLKNGVAHWSDAAYASPAMQMDLTHIELDAQNLSTKEQAAPAHVVASIGVVGSQYLHFDGQVNLPTASVTGQLNLADFALEDFQPYASSFVASTIAGKLAMQAQVVLHDGALSIRDLSSHLDDLKIRASRHEFGGLSAQKIMLDDLSVDMATRHTVIGQISLDQVRGEVFRTANGDINVMHLLKKSPAAKAVHQVTHQPEAAQPAWQAEIGQITMNDSQFVFGDKAVQPAVLVKADAVNIKLNNVSTNPAHPVKLAMRATLNKTGKFVIDGTGSEKALQMNLDVQNFSIPVLQPYFTEFLNISLEKGSISTNGKFSWHAPNEIKFVGGLKLANFLTADKENGDDFLNWKLLEIAGINVDLGGRQPAVSVGKINLNDFYARAILSEKGRLNLQNIVAHPAEQSIGAKTDAHSQPVAPALVPMTAAKSASTSAEVAPIITLSAINLNNGVINYTDNFIKPHYSMRMTGMNGTIGTIQSSLAQSAPININGKVDDEAPIAISGSLNPLFSPMLLDMRMTATGVDLPRLTTYALKYAGYPIVKGKLSLDVEYHIKDNKLEANNALKIDQLTFGDRVDGPDATHLPVPFLISLLTDSNGQINLDLPIAGTINDPQFSIGGLIARVFVNIIEKVVTSPFTLLAHAFGGGGEEMAYIEFDPGSFKLTDAAKAKLDNLAKALTQRPAIKLDMIGRADLATDNAGLRVAILERQIKKTKNLEEDASDATITEAERARAIEKIYAAAKFDKPRNMIGFAKTLPTAEMEKLILANTVVTEDDIRALALRRESVVRAYLTDTAHIPAEKLFSIAPKLSGEGIKDQGAISRVDFELKM